MNRAKIYRIYIHLKDIEAAHNLHSNKNERFFYKGLWYKNEGIFDTLNMNYTPVIL